MTLAVVAVFDAQYSVNGAILVSNVDHQHHLIESLLLFVSNGLQLIVLIYIVVRANTFDPYSY
ncbi:hypothetical protein CXF80_15220 [Shewanella sp. Actino-trap-3]|nr:hypothetical protein CXF80_15220 [Shewanella sp. Actino-trap-3]